MEEKKSIKISLSTFFLILALIVLVIMGIFIFKLYNEKTEEKQKSTELQAQVDNLNGKINEIKETINSNETVDNKNKDNNANKNENKTNTANQTNTSNNSEDSIKNKIIGTWKAYKVTDSKGNDLGLDSVWGTGIRYSNEMQFKENGNLSYSIGITVSNDDGTYNVSEKTVSYGVPTDIKGKYDWHTATYNKEDDTLIEELDSAGEKQIITYVRIK